MPEARWFLWSWYACDDFPTCSDLRGGSFWGGFVSTVSSFVVVAFGVLRSGCFPVGLLTRVILPNVLFISLPFSLFASPWNLSSADWLTLFDRCVVHEALKSGQGTVYFALRGFQVLWSSSGGLKVGRWLCRGGSKYCLQPSRGWLRLTLCSPAQVKWREVMTTHTFIFPCNRLEYAARVVSHARADSPGNLERKTG